MCYLPYFDKETAEILAEEIMGNREPRSGQRGVVVSKVMLKPVTLRRNNDVSDEAIRLIEQLPSYAKPTVAPRPIKRILRAAQALAQDGLVPEADKLAHEEMFKVLDGIAEKHQEVIKTQAKKIRTANIRQIFVERGETEASDSTVAREADATTVDDALRHLKKMITASLVNRYL